MKIFKQQKAPKREDGVDLISNMPDYILLLILSRLPSTEEVIRTSILSTRWRYLWTSIPSVEFIIPHESRDELNIDKFKEFVYWILLNRSADLDSFTLFCLEDYNMATIWRWIHATIARNVKQLDLTFEPETEVIEMPHSLVACKSLTTLKLSLLDVGLRLPNYTGFPALRLLELKSLDLLEDEASVKVFLENCPLLDDLSFELCIMNRLNLLCISCPKLKKFKLKNNDIDRMRISCPKLKKFKLKNNDIDRMCGSIRISCPELVDLDIKGYIGYNIFLVSLDSLKQAVIVPKGLPRAPQAELIGNIKSVLFSRISHVEFLRIDLYFFRQCIYAVRDRALPNLKILVLNTKSDAVTMDELKRILNYCPKLESLKLIVTKEFDRSEHWKVDEAATRRILDRIWTPNLNRIEFLQFNGEIPKVTVKPKLVSDHHGNKSCTSLKLVLSWGN